MSSPQASLLRLRRFSFIALLLTAVLIALLWQWIQPSTIPERVEMAQMDSEPSEKPIFPIPLTLDLDARKVALGDRLFHETRLSKNNQISCASCHSLTTGGVDRQVRSPGLNGATTKVNTPTVFNSGFNFRQNWDGKFDTLEAQSDASVLSPILMGGNWNEIINRLRQVPGYVQSFAQIYPNGITRETVNDAIATFERSLYTPNSRFDRHLLGDETAITEDEHKGYEIFRDYGCASCHQGVNIGGNLFQPFGVMGDYFADRGNVTPADFGRFNVTGKSTDRYVFRVPSLRNVTLTPPYFHDGSAETLQQAVEVMAQYQLGRPLAPEQVNLIVQFLNTLTGEYQGKAL
jgi:cytochrome c peroxidase